MDGWMIEHLRTWGLVIISLVLLDHCVGSDLGTNIVKHSEQQEVLTRKELECIGLIAAERQNASLSNGTYCTRVWDNITCWPPTPAGQLAVQPCPSHISNIDTTQFASRQCMADGTWFQPFSDNTTWTNFTQCIGTPVKNSRSVPVLIAIQSEGYTPSATRTRTWILVPAAPRICAV